MLLIYPERHLLVCCHRVSLDVKWLILRWRSRLSFPKSSYEISNELRVTLANLPKIPWNL